MRPSRVSAASSRTRNGGSGRTHSSPARIGLPLLRCRLRRQRPDHRRPQRVGKALRHALLSLRPLLPPSQPSTQTGQMLSWSGRSTSSRWTWPRSESGGSERPPSSQHARGMLAMWRRRIRWTFHLATVALALAVGSVVVEIGLRLLVRAGVLASYSSASANLIRDDVLQRQLRKSSPILADSAALGRSPDSSQAFGDLRSRASVTVPEFRIAGGPPHRGRPARGTTSGRQLGRS